MGNQCKVEHIIISLTRLLATLLSCQGPAIPLYLMYAGNFFHVNFCNQCNYSKQIWQTHLLVMRIYMWWNKGQHPSLMVDTLKSLKFCWHLTKEWERKWISCPIQFYSINCLDIRYFYINFIYNYTLVELIIFLFHL